MSPINWIARRKDTALMVADDPWTIVVFREGRTPSEAETTWTFTGTIQPVGGFGSRATEKRPARLQGELGIAEALWGILAPWDTPALKAKDEVHATQNVAGSVKRVFDVLYCSKYAYKLEVAMHERE